MILKQYWAHSGYDAEEIYFAKINRDLIDRIKAVQQKEWSDTTDSPSQEAPGGRVIPFPTPEQRSLQKKKAA
jgi:hypothetical protein